MGKYPRRQHNFQLVDFRVTVLQANNSGTLAWLNIGFYDKENAANMKVEYKVCGGTLSLIY